MIVTLVLVFAVLFGLSNQALRIADHVIFMYLGEVIKAGPADEVFNNPKQELTQKYLEGAFS
jgi:phosphate transport system ATP-binding protein